jgi:hypothetical protein
MKIFTIGPRPPLETQGEPEAYIRLIREKLGNEVGSAKLRVLGCNVICQYDSDDPVGEEYAKTVRESGPRRWSDWGRDVLADHLDACEVVAGWWP